MQGFSGGSESQQSTCDAGDPGLVQVPPELGRSPGEGNHYLLQYSHLENSMDRGAWGSQRVGYNCAINTFTFLWYDYKHLLSE